MITDLPLIIVIAELSRALDIFCWRNNMKFCSGGEKIRNASGHLGENERRTVEKK